MTPRLIVLILAALAACEPPLPAGGPCSDDLDCGADQRCDLARGQCVPLDAGTAGDAAQSDSAVLDHAAVDQALPDTAAADHNGSDSAAPDTALADGAAGQDSAQAVDAGADAATTSDAARDAASAPDTRPQFFASAGADRQVIRNTRVYLSAAGSVLPQGAAIVYQWTLDVAPAGTTAILVDTDQVECSFVAGDPHGSYEVELVITVDGTPLAPDRVSVDVLNTAPVASAGSDQGVYQGHGVALDGTASYDDDGDDLSFGWVVLAGQGSLDDASSATPTFTPAAGFVGTATLRLLVDDGHGGQASDDVDVIVSDNLPPLIGALGDLQVPHDCAGSPLRCGATASLEATVTDPEGEDFSVLWELLSCPAGDAVGGACPAQGADPGAEPAFTAATAVTTDLVLDEAPGVLIAGVYTVRLTATDQGGRSATATVRVTVQNTAPTGQGGSHSAPHTYASGTYTCQVEFGYSLSDVDGDPLQVSYQVSPQAGTVTAGLPNTAIFRVSSGTPSAALLGPYTITITAIDGQGGSAQFTQTVSCSNTAPALGSISNSTPAGHFYRASGTVYGSAVALAASVDDAEADPVTCTWSVPAPVAGVSYGSLPLILSPLSSFPGSAGLAREITSSPGTQVIASHGFRLSCSDGFVASSRDANVAVTNRAPTANAGSNPSVNHSYSATGNPYRASADLGSRGAGNASASDPDGDPLTYAWQQTSSITGINPQASATTSLTPTFSWSGDTRVVGTHTLRLTVSDGPGASAQSSMNVTVGNRAPVVNAGADLGVNHAYVSSSARYDVVFDLNGRGTKATVSDPDGDPLTYAWAATSTPSGVTYLYSNQAALNPVVTAQGTTAVVGNHDFRLTASDAFGGSASDTVRLTGLNRAPVVSVEPLFSPAPLVVSQTCLQYKPFPPTPPAYCVADLTSGTRPESTYTISLVDPDGDPLSAVVAASINNANGVRVVGYSQSGSSITVSSPTGAPLSISAAVQITNRFFDRPCSTYQTLGCKVGLITGRDENRTRVLVQTTFSDPFAQVVINKDTLVSASNRENCN